MRVGITSAAEADLEAIADYMARDYPVRALSFARELYERCLDIAEMPEAWPIVPRYGHHGIRRRVHGRYLFFYRISQDQITILHVLNGAMDVEALLFPEDRVSVPTKATILLCGVESSRVVATGHATSN